MSENPTGADRETPAVSLREVHDFVVKCIVEDSKMGLDVQPNLDGEWPAVWYQGAGSPADPPDFSTLILAGPEEPDFDAGTPERAAFVVRNNPAHVLQLTGYLRWTCANHEPVLQPAGVSGETAMEVCPIDGAKCKPLLRMAKIFQDRPGFKEEWRWEDPPFDLAEVLAREGRS
ncbi:DUF6221 family protein [Streptomyces anulatus]|uniref:DUF6221 family protein n=1 Tax=Streptomyces anulatus TaxID=1892 RepID=UPI0037DC7701|nr:DUF6221 family protein [Streptomyces anulatus]